MKRIALILSLAVLASGCSTIKKAAFSAASLAKPEYASTIAQAEKLLTEANPYEGVELERVWTYKGQVIDFADLGCYDKGYRANDLSKGFPAPLPSAASVDKKSDAMKKALEDLRAIGEAVK